MERSAIRDESQPPDFIRATGYAATLARGLRVDVLAVSLPSDATMKSMKVRTLAGTWLRDA